MRAKSFITGVGVTMAVVTMGVFFWAKQQTALRLAEFEELHGREADLRARVMRAEARVVTAEKAASDLAASQREGVLRTLEDDDALFEEVRARVRERQDNDPQFQALWAAAEADEYVRLYLPFFRRSGLSAEQIERLRAEYLRGRLMRLDLAAIRRAGGLSSRDSAIAAQEKEAAEARRAVEIAVLGEAGVERMREWERTFPVRSVAMNFAGRAMLASVPLSSDQVERMVDVLAKSGPKAQTGRYSFSTVNWEASKRAAREVLSPEQHAFFAIEAERQRTAAECRRMVESAKRLRAQQRVDGASDGK
jgi:hypothetical protein